VPIFATSKFHPLSPVTRDSSKSQVEFGSSIGTEHLALRSVANCQPGRTLHPHWWMTFVSIIILIASVLFLAYRIGLNFAADACRANDQEHK
jgi:hypothetical protein